MGNQEVYELVWDLITRTWKGNLIFFLEQVKVKESFGEQEHGTSGCYGADNKGA